jgi:hypothetical protein
MHALGLLTYGSWERVNREIPELYAEKESDETLEYIEDEMEGHKAVYQAIKKERFHSELMALRERLPK